MLINKKIDLIAKHFYVGNNSKFGKDFNVSDNTIRRYRLDMAPRFDFLMELVNKLDISWQWLIEDKGEMLSSDRGKVNEPAPGYNENEMLQLQRELLAAKDDKINDLKEKLDKAKEDATYYKRLADQKKKFENTS